MPWVKLDDSFYSHPKVVNAGHEAVGLYVTALSYSSHHLTDGHVPEAWVKQQVGSRTRKLVTALVDQRLWEPNGTGWVIHDYLDYNPTAESIRAKRQKDSERKRDGK
jgi:hypothetical protein